MMSRDGTEHRRNIFDAFLNFTKLEKDDDSRSICYSTKRVSDTPRDCLSPTPSSVGSLGDQWIKPECDPVQEPTSSFFETSCFSVTYNDADPLQTTHSSQCTFSRSEMSSSKVLTTTLPISSTAPSLRISSVGNISESCSSLDGLCYGNTPSAIQQCVSPGHESMSQLPFHPEDASFHSDHTSIPFGENPVQEIPSNAVAVSHDGTSHWNCAFGFLDDLLPENDPPRSAYIHHKCTVLRYPLPLAVSMAKLYSPSQIPSLVSDPQRSTSSTTTDTVFSEEQKPDQGFLEIDDSHFTLNNGFSSTPPTLSNSRPSPPKPLTKAQIRHLRSRRETRQSHSTMPSKPSFASTQIEESSIPEPSVFPRAKKAKISDRRRPLTENAERRTLEKRRRPLIVDSAIQTLPVATHGDPGGQSSSSVVQSTTDLLQTSTTTSSKLASAERRPVSTRSYISCPNAPVMPRTPKNLSSRSPRSCSSPWSNISRFRGRTVMPPLPSRTDGGMIQAVELLAFQLLSSHHFIPPDNALYSHTPHWVTLRAVENLQFPECCYLLFGDVVRLLCSLSASSRFELASEALIHCASTFRTVNPCLVCLQTQHKKVSLEALQFHKSFRLAIVPCPVFSSFSDAMKLAQDSMPLSTELRTCTTLSKMIRVCRTVVHRNSEVQLLKGLRETVQQIHPLVTEATQYLVEQLKPRMLRIFLNPSLCCQPNGVRSCELGDVIPVDLVSYLSPFWWRVLSTALRDPNHIIGLGILVRSFLQVFRHLFHGPYEPKAQPNSLHLTNLFYSLNYMHKRLSVCLCRLRDAYASLVSAGSCLSARKRLALMDANANPIALRLEQGRARLFDSAQAARNNAARILREEICPYLRELIVACNDCRTAGTLIVSDKQLLGSYAADSSLNNHPECKAVAQTIKAGLAALRRGCGVSVLSMAVISQTANTPSTFYRIASQMQEFLEKRLTPYLTTFRTTLFMLSNNLNVSLQAIQSTWIPTFECPAREDEIDCRASSDVQFLTSTLQTQYDTFEAWLRKHYNLSAPVLYEKMLSLQSLLMKTDLHQAPITSLANRIGRLQIPYGSKNKLLDNLSLDASLIGISLPAWPPLLSDSASPQVDISGPNRMISDTTSPNPEPISDPSLPILIVRRTTSSSLYVIPPNRSCSGNDGSDCTEAPALKHKKPSWVVVSSPSRSNQPLVPDASNLNTENTSDPQSVCSPQTDPVSTAAVTPSGSNTTAKRVCIHLADERLTNLDATEIITERATEVIGMNQTPCRVNRIDRRRLGRLKRRLKISKAACLQRSSGHTSESESMSIDFVSSGSSPSLPLDELMTVSSSDDEQCASNIDKPTAANSVENVPDRITCEEGPDQSDLIDASSEACEKTYTSHSQEYTKDQHVVADSPDSSAKNNVELVTDLSSVEPSVPSVENLIPVLTDHSITVSEPKSKLTATHPIEHETLESVTVSQSSCLSPCLDQHSQSELLHDVDSPISSDLESPSNSYPSENDKTISKGLVVRPSSNIPTLPVSGDNGNSALYSVYVPPNSTSPDHCVVESEAQSATSQPDLDQQKDYLESSTSQNPKNQQISVNTSSMADMCITAPTFPNCTAFPDSVFRSPDKEPTPILSTTGIPVSATSLSPAPSTSSSTAIATQSERLVWHVQVGSPSEPPSDTEEVLGVSDSVSMTSEKLTASSTSDTQHSTRIGLMLERVTAELNELAPWLDKCGTPNSYAPGPITAAVLGRPSPCPSTIDLTADDC